MPCLLWLSNILKMFKVSYKKKSFIKNLLFILLPVVIYFIPAVVTISDYNVNWDEPVHFVRGQAYLRIFLTGEKNYKNLPHLEKFHKYLEDRDNRQYINLPRYSIYQNNAFDGDYFLKSDYGHPALNGIAAAFTNYIFYQQLGLIGDVESYHFFIISVSLLLVILIIKFALEEYGLVAAITALIALSTYPLFIAESHNNIKDPIVTAFLTFTLYAFYRGIKDDSFKWVIFSSIFAGFSLATKLNIIFLPLIIFPWLIARNLQNLKTLRLMRRFDVHLLVSFLLYPLIMFAIFFLSWPFLWENTTTNIGKMLQFYREIGSGVSGQFFNSYAIQWIFYTSPIPTLFLTGVGIISTFLLFKREKNKTSLFLLLWFLFPILRVTFSTVGIYGGVRQIMEYLPSMALLSGLGAQQLFNLIRDKFNIQKKYMLLFTVFYILLILAIFTPTIYRLIKIHPNQNLYFNELIGGLSGAVKKNFPDWHSTLGNPYLQGVHWLNLHAEKDAKLTLALGTMTNIPSIKLREDIRYDNSQESVVWREGEYIMGLTHYGFPLPYYSASYPERYLVPVHEVKVEGIPIVRIWKNDPAHTKLGFLREKELIPKTERKGYELFVDLEKEVFLTRIELTFEPNLCREENDSLYTSLDGVNWKREPEGLLDVQIPLIKKNTALGKIVHLIAAQPARYLKIECYGNLKVFSLRDVFP